MPTQPLEPTPAPSAAPLRPHEHRHIAESFGTDAARYDRTRPRYPQAIVERIVAESPGRDVLDVGCGTGIAGRAFQRAGCTVLGVEPDERMAQFARDRGLEVEVAPIETWQPGGRTFDAVVAAQTWHWVDPVAGAAKARAVLRPRGRLALFWNSYQPPPAIVEALAAALRRAVPDSPFNAAPGRAGDPYAAMLDTAAAGLREVGGFGEPERWRHEWNHTYTKAQWLDQLPTTGSLTRVPADALAEILAEVGAAIDAQGGALTVQHTTVLLTATKDLP
jgi:SAM-dependent methyltransferase